MENQDWATGPLGRRGPWAAGLLLAKPDIFTFKVWFENNLYRWIMKVLYCAIGFCKETNEQKMKTFLPQQHATNRNNDSND